MKAQKFYYPYGLKVLANPTVMVAIIVVLALVIIPVSVIFELSREALIFILVITALSFVALLAMLKPRVYLRIIDDVVTYNTNRFFGENNVSIPISNIERIRADKDTLTVLYVIPVITVESGIFLIDKLGNEYYVSSGCFHRRADYKAFKQVIINSAPDLIN